MKPTMLIISITIILFSQLWFQCDTGFDVYSKVMKAKISLSKACGHLGRHIHYGWLLCGNYVGNMEFLFSPDDAAYFFKRQQRIRDLEPQIREEYYCRNKDPDKLIDRCTWAFSNKKFREKTGWEYNPEGESPECVVENVSIKKYEYSSRRSFLRCPIVIKEDGEEDFFTAAYITSIDDPPIKRLMYFLFMDVTGESTYLGEPPQTPKTPRTPRTPRTPGRAKSIESFRESTSSKSRRAKLLSSFKSLKESSSNSRILEIVSLIMNKRHTLISIDD